MILEQQSPLSSFSKESLRTFSAVHIRKLLMKCWKYTLVYTKKCKPISLIRVLLASVWLSAKNALITLQEGEGDYRHKISKYINHYKCSKKSTFSDNKASCKHKCSWFLYESESVVSAAIALLRLQVASVWLSAKNTSTSTVLLLQIQMQIQMQIQIQIQKLLRLRLASIWLSAKITSSWTQFLQEESKGDLSSQCKNSNDSEG